MADILDQYGEHPELGPLIKELPDRIQHYRVEQYNYDLQAMLNRDFVNDKQWECIIDNRIIEPPRDEGEVRLTENFTRTMVRTFAAQMLAVDMEWRVVPVNADDKRIGVANVGTQVLKQDWIQLQRDRTLHRLAFASFTDGLSYLIPEFDTDSGRTIAVDPRTGKPIKEGQSRNVVKSALDVLVPDRFWDINQAPAIAVVSRMNIKDAQRRFQLPDAPPAEISDSTKLRYKHLYGDDFDFKDMVELYTAWFMSGNGALPDTGEFAGGVGLVFIPSMGNKVVELFTKFPYPFDVLKRYPVIDFHCEERLEHFHSKGIPEIIMGLQMEHNRTISQIAQAKNYIGSPVWRATKGQFTDIDDIPTYAGGVMYYNPLPNVPAPDVVQMPAIPGYIIDMAKNLLKDAGANALGVSEVAMATQPGSVNSYSGIAKLSEIQNQNFRPLTKSWESKWSLYGTVKLMREQKYAELPKVLRITDAAGDVSVREYTKADLEGDFEVYVESTIGETSKEKRQRQIQEVQMKILSPEEYKEQNYGIKERSRYQIQRQTAAEENEAFLAGQPSDNSSPSQILTEDHKLHFEVNSELIASPAYAAMPPQVQAALLKHLEIHYLGMTQPQQLYQRFIQPTMVQNGLAAPPQPAMPQPAQQGNQVPGQSGPNASEQVMPQGVPQGAM